MPLGAGDFFADFAGFVGARVTGLAIVCCLQTFYFAIRGVLGSGARRLIVRDGPGGNPGVRNGVGMRQDRVAKADLTGF